MSAANVEELCDQENVDSSESTQSEEKETPESTTPEQSSEETTSESDLCLDVDNATKNVNFDIASENEYEDVFEKPKYRSTSPDKIRVNRKVDLTVLAKYITKKSQQNIDENISQADGACSAAPLEPVTTNTTRDPALVTLAKEYAAHKASKNGKKNKEVKVAKSDSSILLEPLRSTNPLAVLDGGVTEYTGNNCKFVVNPCYRSSSEDSEETLSRQNISTLDGRNISAQGGSESNTFVITSHDSPRKISLCQKLFSFLRPRRKRKED